MFETPITASLAQLPGYLFSQKQFCSVVLRVAPGHFTLLLWGCAVRAELHDTV